MPTYLFAYGTLQTGLAPAAIRPYTDRLVPIDRGTASGEIYDLGAYPGARFDRAGVVHGTVFQVPAEADAALLASLDAYEGVPELYIRVAIPVTVSDGRCLTCWAYHYNQDVAGRAPIPTGRYVREVQP